MMHRDVCEGYVRDDRKLLSKAYADDRNPSAKPIPRVLPGLKAARVFSERNHSCTGIAASEAPIRPWRRKERSW